MNHHKLSSNKRRTLALLQQLVAGLLPPTFLPTSRYIGFMVFHSDIVTTWPAVSASAGCSRVSNGKWLRIWFISIYLVIIYVISFCTSENEAFYGGPWFLASDFQLKELGAFRFPGYTFALRRQPLRIGFVEMLGWFGWHGLSARLKKYQQVATKTFTGCPMCRTRNRSTQYHLGFFDVSIPGSQSNLWLPRHGS